LRLSSVLAALLIVVLAAPLAAYTIYFKDGSRLIAREKYRIEGEKAYIVLQNGAESVYNASEIDVERTREANQSNYGTALVLEDGKVKETAIENVPRREQPTLRDLIKSGAAGPSNVPDRPRPDAAPEVVQPTEPEPEPTGPGRTLAGFLDLATLEHRGFADLDLAGELSQEFLHRELTDVHIYQGSTARRPLVEIVTGSETSVFRAIRVAAVGLLELEQRYPGQIEAIELLLVTPKGARAGQFVITPERVDELRTLDTPTFYLRYVQF
jgi:hypothetical protein